MLSVSVRQSVTTFWEYFTNGSDDFNHFLHAAFIRMRRDDTKFRFGPKTIKGLLGGLMGGAISKLPLFLFTVRFFWNLKQCFSLLLQGDSIWLKPTYQKGVTSLFEGRRGAISKLPFFFYHSIFQKFESLFHNIIAR